MHTRNPVRIEPLHTFDWSADRLVDLHGSNSRSVELLTGRRSIGSNSVDLLYSCQCRDSFSLSEPLSVDSSLPKLMSEVSNSSQNPEPAEVVIVESPPATPSSYRKHHRFSLEDDLAILRELAGLSHSSLSVRVESQSVGCVT